jgi:putative ABC transport system permease protein
MKRLLLELALLAYPRAFRKRFGDEIRKDLAARAFGTSGRSGTSDTSGTLGTLGTLVLSGLAERGSAVRRLLIGRTHDPHLYTPSGRHHMFWDTLRGDVQYTLRVARRSPMFTSAVVVTLALGIGANSAIFTAVKSMLLEPLPYRDAERLVMVWSHNVREARDRNTVSPANFSDYASGTQSLESLDYMLSFLIPLPVRNVGDAAAVQMMRVGPRVFDILGREALIGRTPREGDRDVAVISHGLWTRLYGNDPRIIGRSLVLAGDETLSIIGVMPQDFVFPYRTMLGPGAFGRALSADVWAPMPLEGPRFRTAEGVLIRQVHFLATIGRMKPGVSVEQAQADLRAVARQLEIAYPETNAGWSATVVPLLDQTVGAVRPALMLLLAGVGVVLLMACINVTSLTLARSVARQREMAVRAAVGAGRGRLVQQSITEGVLLAGLGAAASLVVVRWGVDALVAMAPSTLPRIAEVTADTGVVAFTMTVGILAGVLVGVLPALSASRIDVRHALDTVRGAGRASRAAVRARSTLVIAQIALAVTLSVAATLMMRSFLSVLAIDPGFNSDQLLTMQINVPDRFATPESRRTFYEEWFDRLERIPGVVAVGGTTRVPLGSGNVTTVLTIEGRDVSASAPVEVEFRRSMRRYFDAMQMRIVHGRGFDVGDGPGAPPVAVVNQTFVRRVFPNEEPLGRRVRMGVGNDGPWLTIVGVVGDVRHGRLEEVPSPELYVDYRQNPPVGPFIVVRTVSDPAALAAVVRAEARAFDPTMPLYDITTMNELRAAAVAERRFISLLVALFGALAFGTAIFGVYGVMTLTVSERTPEVGVRVALGAGRAVVLTLILGQAARLAFAGAALGLGLALALTPLLESQLYGVGARDVATLAGVPALLVAVALVAALIPAQRAARIDPASALRHD